MAKEISKVNQLNSEDMYRFLFDAAGVGMCMVNRAQIILTANPMMHTLFGYPNGELVGQSIDLLIPKEFHGVHSGHTAKYFSKPKPRIMGSGMVLSGVKKDGSKFPLEISLNYFTSKDEMYAIAQVIDITKRVADQEKITQLNEQLEEKVNLRTKELSQSQKLYSTIAENFPDGTINVFDTDYCYLFVKGKELTRMGVTGESLIGKNLVTSLPKEAGDLVRTEFAKVFSGEHRYFEMKVEDRYYEMDAVPLTNIEGKIDRILVIERNVTRKKEAERDIKNALEKEREVNNLKSRFVSMAFHEFRTPLAAILSSASLIEKYTQELHQEKREKHVKRIKSSVKNLTSILDDFLSYDNLQSGKIGLKPSTIDLPEFIQHVIDEVRPTFRFEQGIAVTEDFEVETVVMDEKLLRNILINLISNASKYSDEGQNVFLKAMTTLKVLSIEVRDEGIGIPEEEQEQIFERFFRANNVTNIQGTGLGLSIVKKYIDLMGGTISFTSRSNEGTTINIELPLTEQDEN